MESLIEQVNMLATAEMDRAEKVCRSHHKSPRAAVADLEKSLDEYWPAAIANDKEKRDATLGRIEESAIQAACEFIQVAALAKKSLGEREALKRIYMSKGKDEPRLETVINELEMLPAAGVVPVVHGEWEVKRGNYVTGGGNPLWQCSNCEWIAQAAIFPPKYKYCPKCGAKMDGGGDQ